MVFPGCRVPQQRGGLPRAPSPCCPQSCRTAVELRRPGLRGTARRWAERRCAGGFSCLGVQGQGIFIVWWGCEQRRAERWRGCRSRAGPSVALRWPRARGAVRVLPPPCSTSETSETAVFCVRTEWMKICIFLSFGATLQTPNKQRSASMGYRYGLCVSGKKKKKKGKNVNENCSCE